MGKVQTLDIVSPEVLERLYQRMTRSILLRGGTNEHIDLLLSDRSDSAMGRFADEVIALQPKKMRSFKDIISAGSYDFLWGVAQNPENICGTEFTPMEESVVENLELHAVPTGQNKVTSLQIYTHFQSNMASPSELLYFGMLKPTVQLTQDVVVLWQDPQTHRLWSAILTSRGKRGIRQRQLGISTSVSNNRPDPRWNILLRSQPKLF